MPSQAVEAFLGRFPTAKKTGKQWLVVCPAHADKNPSLAVSDGDDGRVLLNCHAGCTYHAILDSLNLTDADLFPPKDPEPKRSRPTIVATYEYKDEAGVVLYRVVRKSDKTFVHQRHDETGWHDGIDGIRRVLYRLPELAGKQAVLITEGEKDADAAWALGIPATTNSGGAKAWKDEHTEQLRALGIKRVAIPPDNDVPGYARAADLAKTLTAVAIQVQIVPLPDLQPKGDLFDYFAAGHSKDDLLALIRATPAWTTESLVLAVADSQPITLFERLDQGHYRWSIMPPGVVFEIDHIHQHHSETSGELTVRCDIAGSAKSDNGALVSAHCNLTSLPTRKTWAKDLESRAKTNGDVDWLQLFDNFCNHVLDAEKQGEPVVALTGVRRSETVPNWYTINGLTLHQRHPSCIFGWGGVGKSFVALYCAGVLAQQGVNVLYVDGELDQWEHNERCAQLFGEGAMTNLLYIRLRNLQLQRDYLKRVISENRIQFIVVDSITKLAGGKLEESDTAKGYIDALDSLNVGSLNVAHITKSAQGGDVRPQDQKIFGASQWDQLLRHSWFVKGDGNHPTDATGTALGFYLTKSNSARIGTSIGWRFIMTNQEVTFAPCDLVQTELAKHEPIKARLSTLLATKNKMLSYEEAADELGVKPESIRKTVLRNSRSFRKLDGADGRTMIGLAV
jgi:hypothetical protein